MLHASFQFFPLLSTFYLRSLSSLTSSSVSFFPIFRPPTISEDLPISRAPFIGSHLIPYRIAFRLLPSRRHLFLRFCRSFACITSRLVFCSRFVALSHSPVVTSEFRLAPFLSALTSFRGPPEPAGSGINSNTVPPDLSLAPIFRNYTPYYGTALRRATSRFRVSFSFHQYF